MAISASDPRQIIIDYLSMPVKVIATIPASDDQVWRTRITNGGWGAKAETIRFLKMREIPGRQLYAVTFENEEDQDQLFICYLVQDKCGRWQFRGGAGGSHMQGLVRNDSQANSGANSHPDDFYAGGYVADPSLEIECVRLVANNGLVLEDTVQEGVVLFVTEQSVSAPLQAEFYDRLGTLVDQRTLS